MAELAGYFHFERRRNFDIQRLGPATATSFINVPKAPRLYSLFSYVTQLLLYYAYFEKQPLQVEYITKRLNLKTIKS